jgi:hypothetical protein
MPTVPDNQSQEHIQFPGLPLAVYRELAAHLRQVPGVEAGLIPQTSQQFDYHQSQIGGLWIEYSSVTSSQSRERVQQILAYYKKRYNT